MKQKRQKRAVLFLCAILTCMGLLCGTASAATLVVIDLADVVDGAAPSVVEVFTETKQVSSWFQEYVTEGAGSGVVLSEEGYIVTNHHVIDGANTIKVRLSDGQTYAATLTGADEKTDLAVIKISASGLTAAKLADSSAARVGDFVIAIGNPLGELGGVVNAKSSGDDIEGLAFAIPANTVKEITQELIQYGYVTGRPQLGIIVAQITRPGMGRQTYYSTPGLYITQSSEDNGLKAGDRIIQIDSTTINNASDVSDVLDRHSVGEVVKVVVSRNGKETTVNVKLTEQKPS